ncbi:unnamed protein product [Dovyalis caffra]|uniref:Uncharacterized protein n=1 Tax=Dovyalis caffra TaxID=77055 RepID=A0AAV1RDU0_9ROSI|nr:unnamed protein product [Dovyalis caffra]
MGASENVSELVFNEVKFDNFESSSHEVVRDFDDDRMAVHSIASTNYIAAPTVSASNCAKNLQPIALGGCSDKGVGVLTIETTTEADHELDSHLDSKFRFQSERPSDRIVFAKASKANPTCPIQENEVRMIPNTLYVESSRKVFIEYGKVNDLFIANKITKLGSRFGFVQLESDLKLDILPHYPNEIWFGSFKLRVNLSRFENMGLRKELFVLGTKTSRENEADPSMVMKLRDMRPYAKWFVLKEQIMTIRYE